MAINLNRQPYFDDFDKNSNFVKILFKPARPVQVRELNQLQSIQKHQLELFANHMFKEGSKIEGRAPKQNSVKFITFKSIPDSIKILLKPGVILRGATNEIEASIIQYTEEVYNLKPNTLYINYTKTGKDNTTSFFADNEILHILDNGVVVSSSFITVRSVSNPDNPSYVSYPTKGNAVLWKIAESIFYSHGYFVEVQPSSVIGEEYSSGTESYSIGFDVQEEIIDTDDPIHGDSLFDNALGYPNYVAPGADRLKLNLTLTKQPLDTTQTENFILLVKVENGILTYVKSRTDYSTIMETLAERTYDESGNYTVTPITVKFRDHLKKSETDSYGLFYAKHPSEEDGTRVFGDENKFVAIISPIKAYIKGYLVETIAESKIELTKARTLAHIEEFYDRFNTLNYILVELNTLSVLSPNDTSDTSIFTNKPATLTNLKPDGNNAPAGDDIGTITIYDIEKDSVKDGKTFYRVYFTDLVLFPTYTTADIQSIYKTGDTYFLASLENAPFSIFNNDKKTLICELGKSSVYSILGSSNNGLDYSIKRRLTSSVIGDTVTFNAIDGEIFDDYNPMSSFIHIYDQADGKKITEIVFTDADFTDESTLTVTLDDNAQDGKYAILYQKTIKRNNSPKIKYLKLNEIAAACAISNDGIITLANKTDLIYISSIIKTGDLNEFNVIDNFDVFDGQTDTAYLPISLRCNNAAYLASLTTGGGVITDTFDIIFTHYNHSNTGDYFSIDSYKNIIADPNISFGYEDVPNYTSYDQVKYALSDCLDFRPTILNTNKVQTNRPAINGIFNCDISYYLPRYDYIVIDQTGKIYQKFGKSSETPKPPNLDSSGSEMAIMLLKMKPYVYNVRTDVIKNAIENKRYTMRDINKLENRINNLEYYTSFTLLEMQTENASIKDEMGLDRYKNGFIADNFQDFQIADLQSSEFRAAHDKRYSELRPAAYPYNTNLIFNEETSKNYIRIGNKIIIDFNEEKFITQPFSSKSVSLNPYFIFERKGIMKLFPDSDNWVDTKFLPELSVTIDTGVDMLIPSEPLIETMWGSWNTMSEINITQQKRQESQDRPWGKKKTIVETKTDIHAESQQRTGTEITKTYDTRVDQYDLGVRITDSELMTYARSFQTVFAVGNLKPNTRIYAFYDDVPVSSYCAPWSINSAYGDPLISDNQGNLFGVFEIPENTFFTGQKIFRLTNELNDDRDQDTLLTSAEAKFWSGGLALTKQGTTLNVNAIEMNITQETLTQNRVEVKANTSTTLQPYTPSEQNYESSWSSSDVVDGWQFASGGRPSWNDPDPLAQTFFVDTSCFITAFDIYFDQIGDNDIIWVQLKNTENGYPGTTIYGETRLHSSTIQTSIDASIPSKILFPFPVFLEGGKEYAMVIGAYSPESRIYCSLLGKNDLTYPELLISTQTSMGTLFKGQNNTTWTACQYEDMKINIYRANFKYDYLLAVLENETSKESITELNPFETEASSSKVRVYARNHGLTPNDRVKFQINENTTLILSQIENEQDITNIGINQLIESYDTNNVKTGQAIIKSKRITLGAINTVTCELTDIQGTFTKNDYIKTKEYTRNISGPDLHIMNFFTSSQINQIVHPEIKATISQIFTAEFSEVNTTLNTINGIPTTIFNTPITVETADSIDTFIFDTGDAASSTGKAGGNVKFDINRRYELFNVNGAYSSIDCAEDWKYYGISQTSNGLFSDYSKLEGKRFLPYTDVFLKYPYKFANSINETTRVLGKNISITAEFFAKTRYVSPVLDISTFNTIMVSNRVDFIDENEMTLAPSGSNRFIEETDPVLGSEVFKYVSKNIVLKNSALDLKIFVDVYKPIYTDFDIYVKIQPTWDYTSIETKDWIKIDPVWKDFTSKDLTDYREIQILTNETMPELFGTPTITYPNTIGEFSSFKVKIVGRARNPANPPLFRRLRVIALT